MTESAISIETSDETADKTLGFPPSILSVSRDELDDLPLTVRDGTGEAAAVLPPDLQGHVFIVGPAGTLDSPPLHPGSPIVTPTKDGFTPLYNGDGMVYRISFGEAGTATIKTKIAQTESFVADQILHHDHQSHSSDRGSSRYPNLTFHSYGITRGSSTLGVTTQLSVTLNPFRFAETQPYRLLLTVDMGRPYEIDPTSLDMVQPIGLNRDWHDINPLLPLIAKIPFRLLMSTAHPSFDFEKRALFTTNLGRSLAAFSPWLHRIFAQFPELAPLLKPADAEQDSKRATLLSQNLLRHLLGMLIQSLEHLLDDGWQLGDKVELIRWRGDAFERWTVVLSDGTPIKVSQTMHQIWSTRNHIILLDTAFKISLEELIPYDPYPSVEHVERLLRDYLDEPQLADTPVYIIRHDDLVPGQPTVTAQTLTIPREIAHYVVDYDDSDGIILHTAHNSACDASETLRSGLGDQSVFDDPDINDRTNKLSGMLTNGTDQAWIGGYVIHPSSNKQEAPTVNECLITRDFCWGNPIYAHLNMTLQQPEHLDDLFWIFYGAWDDLLPQHLVDVYEHYPYRQMPIDADPGLPSVKAIARAGSPTTLCRVHVERMGAGHEMHLQLTTPDIYAFPKGYFANSLQFVPRQGEGATGSSTDGYLTCVVLFRDRIDKDVSEIWIFDAQNLAAGPCYRLSHDRLKIGFTIHTTWLPALPTTPAGSNYSIRDDYETLVADVVKHHGASNVGREIRSLFNQIYDQFDDLTQQQRIPPTVMAGTRWELTHLPLDILEGEIPSDLGGHLFVVAPVGTVNSSGVASPNGDPLFNGDGMVYRIDFPDKSTPGNHPSLTCRLMKSPCFHADAASRPKSKYADLGFRNHGISRFSVALGTRNELNTAFLPIRFGEEDGDRLLVTYDAGRPYELDLETLELITPIGWNHEWRPETTLPSPFPAVLSTAHPYFDPEQKELLTVNYGRSVSNFLEGLPLATEVEQVQAELIAGVEAIAKLFNLDGVVRTAVRGAADVFQILLGQLSAWIELLTSIKLDNFTYLIRWDGHGDLERWRVLLPDGSPVAIHQSLHQIGVTRNYIILAETAFSTGLAEVFNNPIPENQAAEQLLRNTFATPPAAETRLYIIRRADLVNGQRPAQSDREVTVMARSLTIPMEVLHFAVDYDDQEGRITLHLGHICAADSAEWLRRYDTSPAGTPIPSTLNGMLVSETDISRLGRYVIDAESGELLEAVTIADDQLTWGVALCTYPHALPTTTPAEHVTSVYWNSGGLFPDLLSQFILDLFSDYPNRLVPLDDLTQWASTERGKPSSLFRLDTRTMTLTDHYRFPTAAETGTVGYIANSPQFVPSQKAEAAEHEGYVTCVVFTGDRSELWIFDAEDLAKPLCRIGHPSLKFGYTLHTVWLPQIHSRRAAYQVPVVEDYQDLVKKQSDRIQAFFEHEVFCHYRDLK